MALDRSEAGRIAELAQLDLDDDELATLVGSMAGLVSLIDELAHFETLGETLGEDRDLPELGDRPAIAEQDDVPEPGLDPRGVRANAPAIAADGTLLVPPMMSRVPRS